MEDFTYSKTSHLWYIRDHRGRAGLSALTTSSHETLSIRPSVRLSIPASGSRAVRAFKPNLSHYAQTLGAGVRRSAARPTLRSHPYVVRLLGYLYSGAATRSHTELTPYKARKSMTHLKSTKCAQSRKAFQTKIKSNQREITCHCLGGMLLL